ncbi:Stealth CR1 domain-containing protein [Latilactobacillus sakei]|uniref:Stealth CR1 domain-containing protein n=1 Tax=Latilactobacillus sakei TaxID=1599 RepID=UPI003CF73904
MKIDFVLLWVNDSDKDWLAKRKRFSGDSINKTLNSDERFRDYDLLKYWFRSVEKYASWVNHIFLVTDNQKPGWLNTDNEKIRVIDHSDFLDQQNLPVFNSNAIELNIDKIKDLSENFVLFNDDMFINDFISEELFFKNNLPTDSGILNPIIPEYGGIGSTINNNMEIINKYFNMRKAIYNHPLKYINIKYGVDNIRTLALLLWHKFPGFINPHIPIAYTKTEFKNARDIAKEQFEYTSRQRFRTKGDISHWLIRYNRLAKGEFIPITQNIGRFYTLLELKEITRDIQKSKHKMICINDENVDDFRKSIKVLDRSFQKKYSIKSGYEN